MSDRWPVNNIARGKGVYRNLRMMWKRGVTVDIFVQRLETSFATKNII